MSPSEHVDRAREVYRSLIGSELERANRGRFVALDIESRDFEIGDDRLEVSKRLRDRHPNAIMSVLRIGYPAIGRIGSRNRPVAA